DGHLSCSERGGVGGADRIRRVKRAAGIGWGATPGDALVRRIPGYLRDQAHLRPAAQGRGWRGGQRNHGRRGGAASRSAGIAATGQFADNHYQAEEEKNRGAECYSE